ncbi:MAG: hypothetical protein WBN99_11705 [Mycobacterium sp.]|nr:hypothetical protein [Mycobacterium sp.]
MAERAVKHQKAQKKAVVKKTSVKKAAVNTEDRGARIVVLTGDPGRRVEILPGCHLDSLGRKENAYFFEDGNELVGMIVEGGTVEYHAADRTYVVRLTDGQHSDE